MWSLDIEWGELPALKGVDWNRQRPTFILVETKVFAQIDAFLGSVGHDVVRKAVATGDGVSNSGWAHTKSHDFLWRDRFAGADVPTGPSQPTSWLLK